MAFLVGGANSAVSGYDIENSLRLNSGDSPNLSWTPSSSGNQTICTFSCWVKRSLLGSHLQPIWSTKVSTAGTNAVVFMPANGSTDKMHLVVAGTDDSNFGQTTSNTFRDVSAWYHLVARIDTTQGTAANRIRAYVNGESVTLSGTPGYPDEDETCRLSDNDRPQTIGEDERDNIHFDGYVSEVAFIDGASLAPTSFAETDEDSGIWKPKDFKDDVTFGTNGYYLEFKETGTSQNSSGIGADTSGNDNHFAVTNLAATDITTDTPTNNFATLNSITDATNDLSEGNTVSDLDDGTNATSTTIFAANGKWYAEFKVTDLAGSNSNIRIGVVSAEQNAVDLGGPNETYAFLGDGRKYVEGSASSYGSALNVNDIVMVALDTDNNKVWYGANGTWFASGDPSSNSNESHAIDSGPSFGFAIASGTSSASPEIQCNFGNPPFSISSGNSDDNGFGNFEYDVPTGFYSLCTKNLAEYG